MPANSFRFVSPGVRTNEIDQTELPQVPGATGPLCIGRARKGPFMKPVTVSSKEELFEIFGTPVSGVSGNGDVWRQGDVLAPTYGIYAAIAHLTNGDKCTFVRLGGDEHPSRTDGYGEAGWKTDITTYTNAPVKSDGGAYALFLTSTSAAANTETTDLDPASVDDLTWYGTLADGVENVMVKITLTPGLPAADKAAFSTDNGATWSAGADIVAGVDTALAGSGMSVVWGAISGHTVDDIWKSELTLTSVGSDTHDSGSVAGPAPTLDDIIWGGARAAGIFSVAVRIKTAPAAPGPDTFEYSINGAAFTGAENCTVIGAPFTVPDTGITVAFGVVTGHVVGDLWTASATMKPLVHAATFYVNDGAMALEGLPVSGGASTAGTATLIRSVGSDFAFDVRLFNSINTLALVSVYDQKIRFNFNDNSNKYVRKMFNTNPTLTNSTITPVSDRKDLWLGETYRSAVYEKLGSPAAGAAFGVLLKIQDSTSFGSDYLFPMSFSRSGWIFAQDMSIDGAGDYGGSDGNFDPTTMQKLFRFHCLESGEWAQSNLKISIDNIKYSTSTSDPYGKFDVVIRSAQDTDRRPVVLERFAQCDLNPASVDFVGRRVGTRYIVWSDEERKYKRFGEYDNRSKYIRIELASQVLQGSLDAAILPWGYYGETVFADVVKGYQNIKFLGTDWLGGYSSAVKEIALGLSATTDEVKSPPVALTFSEAKLRLRASSSEEDTTLPKDVFWGVRTTKYGTTKFDSDYGDYVRCHSIMQKDKSGDDAGMDYSCIFTLDDVCYQLASPVAYTIDYSATYIKDSYLDGQSITSGYKTDTSAVDLDLEPSYKYIIDAGFARFTLPLFGGHDGRNVRERDMFRNSGMSAVTSAEDAVTNAPFYTLLKAIDIIASKDKVKYDKVLIPGITNSIIIDKLIDVVQRRNDAICLFDVSGLYTAAAESDEDEEERIGSLQAAVDWMQNRDLNTAYAACWGNWFKIVDRWNSNGFVWVPGSVVGLGLIAYAQKVGNVWGAPAGFNRGNLSLGHAGLNVVDVFHDWDDEEGGDKDILFVNHMNPVVKYPEGIICMGDVTTLRTSSVLKSIGTRLMVNYIKDNVSFYAKRVLFDPNIMITWNRFISDVDPFLRDIQVGGGLANYKVVLDSSTTTQDLVDRNIMYAKIYLAPTEPGKFFGIDFILTRNGAEFAE